MYRFSLADVLKAQESAEQIWWVLYFGEFTSDTHQSRVPTCEYDMEVPGSADRPKPSVSPQVPRGVLELSSLGLPMPSDPRCAVTGPKTLRQEPFDCFCQAVNVALVADVEDAATVTIWVALPTVTGTPKFGGATGFGATGFGATGCGAGRGASSGVPVREPVRAWVTAWMQWWSALWSSRPAPVG